ncbi:hypothetical protein RDWZM_003692 [Blomia tropicalis]|uniref:PPM-type phosphatase domain-containing protein n=1 Tax=Blomia tropicalis TaxID=40697 RepID=A0A9Q0MIT2_BLOTA|nr:hypothetical protein BLOT_002707 [Blomia tropicalis]KAJ6225147.1 hypothetical protein RDWZM_003692 [Blomia tropicalis]
MANPYLFEPIRVKETHTGHGQYFEYSATNCQGWRNTQEDVHLTIPNFEENACLFAVFDGHNGIEVAAYVGEHLPNYIRNNSKYQSGRIEEGLKEAFVTLDNAIKKDVSVLQTIRNIKHPSIRTLAEPGISSGCTAVVCIIKNNIIYCANLGDSRCILSRNGKSISLSQDHNPDVPSENERITKAGGTVAQGRINSVINVSRAFGDHLFKDNNNLSVTEQMIIAVPDVTVDTYQNETDNFIVLMCDGIWNSMDNQEVVDYVQSKLEILSLSNITEQIINDILPDRFNFEQGIKGKDNMTIVIVKFIPKLPASQIEQ